MLFIILLLIVGLLPLLLLYSGRSRRANEPPLDKGYTPWLGHALEFGKDAAKFLTRMKNKHGDIFTVRVAGQYITVLLDPNSYNAVLYDNVSLDFTRNRGVLMKNIFSVVLPSHNPDKERAWMEEHFQGVSLDKLRLSMDTHLRGLLLADQRGFGAAEWREEGLFELCYGLLFRAGYLTMFAREDNADAVYKQFRNFDRLLPKLARSTLKGEEKNSATSSQESLWRLLCPPGPGGGPRGSGCWQESYRLYLHEAGADADTQSRAVLMQLWTTQCNAGPAAFWLLGLLLRHPEAMQAVLVEVRAVMQEHSLHHSALEQLLAHHTPVFDSVLRETLRLTAAAFISREVVVENKSLVVNGQEYCLRKGDKVCLFPFLSPQMDPEIHQEPESFRYKRFLNPDMSEKQAFYKGGGRLRYYSMPWGAGGNRCVGKQFAVSTVKMFVFTVLSHLELEMCEPTDALPLANPQRYGFGMLQPDGDLKVRYRFKRN